MKTTKLAGLAAVAMLVGSLAGCAGGTKEVAILVPSADHGWTGAILTNAQAYAAELETKYEGEYTFHVYTSNNSSGMINQMRDLVARGNGAIAGVVTLPWDASAKPGVEELANAGIPFVVVDRVITDSNVINNSDYWVGDVRGNNEMIGELTAEKFLTDYNLTKDEKILVIPGDNSSVPIARNNGFQAALTEAGWTEAEIKAAWEQLPETGWSRAEARKYFAAWLNAAYAADNTLADYRLVFTHDSEISMGILEELADPSSSISTEAKTAFGNKIEVIASSSGLQEMYDVIAGKHDRQSEFDAYVAEVDFFDVTYPPEMIRTGLDDMMTYLTTGEKIANHDHVVPVQVVDASNVANFTGF